MFAVDVKCGVDSSRVTVFFGGDNVTSAGGLDRAVGADEPGRGGYRVQECVTSVLRGVAAAGVGQGVFDSAGCTKFVGCGSDGVGGEEESSAVDEVTQHSRAVTCADGAGLSLSRCIDRVGLFSANIERSCESGDVFGLEKVYLGAGTVCADDVKVGNQRSAVSSKAVLLGPNGGASFGRGVNYVRNQERRDAKKARKCGKKLESSCSALEVELVNKGESNQNLSDSDKLKKSLNERRIAENELATQRARYNIRRNDYLQKARVSEQRWETERLSSDEKLRKITEARLGASPGFAKTIVEEGLASPSAPSLSDGTVSPNSSISVEEVQKMNRTIEKQAAAVVELQKKLDKFVEMFGDEGETADDIIYPEQRKRDSTPQEPTHKVMWGECVPLKGRYKFQADHHQNGNLVMAIDGEIVEVDWRGEPFEYCGKDVLYVTPSMNGHIDE